MPKKPTKSRRESVTENYFPVEKEDLERATEKAVAKPIPREEFLRGAVEKSVKAPLPLKEIRKGSIEKIYKKIDRKDLEKIERAGTISPIGEKVTKKKKSSKKKAPKKKTSKKSKRVTQADKVKNFSPPKVKLLSEDQGYELIITEKPQAASKIAAALGKEKKQNNRGVPYYEVDRNGHKIVVACAVGHLLTLKQNQTGSEIPIFDISWVPNFIARKGDFTKKYYETILKLVKGANSLTVATDFDIEGEVIGRNIVKFICGQSDAKRMKFSTLTDPELNRAYESRLPTIVWGQAIAGETRHFLDWFYGINLSRALMNAIKSLGAFKLMSIGRVQGPALKLVVDKEKEIKKFISEDYWQVFIKIQADNSEEIELKYIKDIFDKKELKDFVDLKGKIAKTQTDKKQESLPPPPPFNLTTLQTETYKFHGISPSKTLRAAQSLYLSGYISYPRTSSQKLPEEIGYKQILKKLSKFYQVGYLIKKEKPVEGKKTDPAHPSIYPTGEAEEQKAILAGDEEKVYNLIVKRFLSLFCENALIDKKKITALAKEKKFTANGSAIAKKAWLAIYPSKLKEIDLPDATGDKEILDIRNEQKETQPPKRFSPASIVSELEKRNLGTKATRANIIETLYDRGYVSGQNSIGATPLGISLIETLEKYSPIIIDEKLTRSFEDKMASIEKEKSKTKLQAKQEEILQGAKEKIIQISKDFKKQEKEIGQELLNANKEAIEVRKKENRLMPCPKCKEGNLIINYSKKTKRYFVACDAYPKCTHTLSLPPNGLMKPAGKNCLECNYPMILSLRKGKRPWIFCFNPECPTNKERLEEYRKKKAEEENSKEQ